MRRIRFKAAIGTAAAVATAAGLVLAGPTTAKDPPAHAAAVGVTITGTSTYAFAPPKVKIKAGKKVNWSWSSNAQHNVTFTDGKHSATGQTGSFSRRFRAPGTYKYICTIHGFHGKVVVRG